MRRKPKDRQLWDADAALFTGSLSLLAQRLVQRGQQCHIGRREGRNTRPFVSQDPLISS